MFTWHDPADALCFPLHNNREEVQACQSLHSFHNSRTTMYKLATRSGFFTIACISEGPLLLRLTLRAEVYHTLLCVRHTETTVVLTRNVVVRLRETAQRLACLGEDVHHSVLLVFGAEAASLQPVNVELGLRLAAFKLAQFAFQTHHAVVLVHAAKNGL